MRARFRAAALAAALTVSALVAAPATAATPTAGSPRVSVLAEGLDGPRGVATDTAGNTYVAESGVAGDDCFGEGEEEICLGTSSRITRVAPDGTVDRDFVTGLPSLGIHGDYVGASGVSIAPDGTVYVSVGLGANANQRDDIVGAFPAAAMFGTLVRVAEDGELEIVADLAQFEDAVNPDGVAEDEEAGPDSNPNGLLATDDVVYVADAGGNTVLAVDHDSGDITVAAVFPERMVAAPPFPGLPPELPMQAVPTSLALAGDGRVLVGQLTGFPFPVGGANVYALTDDAEAPTTVAEGFTNIMAVAERGAELFVLELARDGLLSGDLTGALVRVRADGSRASLLAHDLQFPGGMAVTPTGAIHISNGAVFPGGGELLAFDARPPADPSIDLACPPGAAPSSALSDVAGSVHLEAIDCTAWWGLFRGFTDGTFGPNLAITRAQFATTVARLVAAAGGELPDGGPTFPDVPPGSTHGAAIRSLAAAGVIEGFDDGTFRPGRQITRAQAASLVARAYAHISGAALPPGPNAFDDDDGSPHESSIDAGAQAGWLQGVGDRRFAPQRSVTRAQVSSMLARVASTLVGDGLLELPR
jgi:hypothetical protein